MKTFAIVLSALFMSAAAFAQEVSFDCQANGSKMKITYEGRAIKLLTVDGYAIIRDGERLAENVVGHDVFDITVGELRASGAGTREINVGLQDYSDVRHWQITLSESSREAAMVSTFSSSDGDGLVHVSAARLTCK